jgi:hypothetical protein
MSTTILPHRASFPRCIINSLDPCHPSLLHLCILINILAILHSPLVMSPLTTPFITLAIHLFIVMKESSGYGGGIISQATLSGSYGKSVINPTLEL